MVKRLRQGREPALSKKPTLICALTLRQHPETPESPLQPFFSHGVHRDELGVSAISFTIYLLFADGQGEWPIEVNLVNVEGVRTGRPLPLTVNLESALSIEPVMIDTGIRITRFGYSWITVDLDGETVARVPFHIYELEPEGGNT